MTYVPGFTHDIFLSYAHGDSKEWIRALEESLRQQLRERLGVEVRIWQDTNNIRFGQAWPDEIQQGVQSAAAFLAVLSPSYQNSDWCAKERRIFLDHCRASQSLKAGSYYRFLKLLKMPWPDDGHEEFHQEFQYVSFFERRPASGEEIEFVPGTDEFRARVRETSRAIASLLTEMRRKTEAVFVATASEDCTKHHANLRDELRAHSYDVRPQGPLDEGYSDKAILKQLEPAILSVHILGGAYDAFVERQIQLAMEAEKRLVFWLAQEATDAKQKALFESIRSGQKQNGPWSLIESASIRAAIHDLRGMLRPQPDATVPAANGASSIYLLCDPTTPADAGFARELQAKLREREGLRVELPLADSPNVSARPDLHQKLLRECDGLLLYRRAAPRKWLDQTLPDVVYAERLMQRSPVKSKAFLVNDRSMVQDAPSVRAISAEPFDYEDLTPFLEPLRTGGANAR